MHTTMRKAHLLGALALLCALGQRAAVAIVGYYIGGWVGRLL